MANSNKVKTYWPHMILGFLVIGVTLGYWTVKSASSMPVQESNDFMMKYQIADIHINDIMKKKIAFDSQYKIMLVGKETVIIKDNVNSNRPHENSVKLVKGLNEFVYTIEKTNGSVVADANVTFLLTRPHTNKDDILIEAVPYESSEYKVKDVNISEPGRYTLQLRAIIGDKTGYSEIPAYLNL